MKTYAVAIFRCKVTRNRVYEMMESDLKLVTKDQYLKDGGYTTLNFFE